MRFLNMAKLVNFRKFLLSPASLKWQVGPITIHGRTASARFLFFSHLPEWKSSHHLCQLTQTTLFRSGSVVPVSLAGVSQGR